MKRPLVHFFSYQFPALLWAGFIFWISSIPSHRLPKFAHLLNDKLVHAGTFFVLGLLIYRGLATRNTPKLFRWPRLVTAVIAVVIYGFLDEFHQAYVPGRMVDLWDATSDAIGGLLAAAVIILITRRRRTAA